MKLTIKTDSFAKTSAITNPEYNPYEPADLIYNPRILEVAIQPEVIIDKELHHYLWSAIQDFVTASDWTFPQSATRTVLQAFESIDRLQLSQIEQGLLAGILRVVTTALYNNFKLLFIFQGSDEL